MNYSLMHVNFAIDMIFVAKPIRKGKGNLYEVIRSNSKGGYAPS